MADQEIPEDVQVGRCIQNRNNETGAPAQLRQRHGQVDEGVVGLLQTGGIGIELADAFGLGDGRPDLAEHVHHVHPFSLGQLATDQVEGLNAVCSLIDAGDLAIPHVLLHRIFLAVPVTSVDIDRLGANLHRLIG